MLAQADVAIVASLGHAPAPGLLVRALGAGAVPVAARLPAYEEVLGDGDLGLLFERGDVDVLAGQLQRLAEDPDLPLAARSRVAERDASGGAASPTRPRRSTTSWPPLRRPGEPLQVGPRSPRHQRMIDVDIHMHTDHSSDCVTPVDVLLSPPANSGLGAIAVTDHNEISGALDARAKAAEYGIKVIVGEEVKTADQGEVIGLFIEEKIPRGMSLEETIAEIRRQGGLVYVPHPFDRLHSVPDYEHLLKVVDDVDAIEIFNPRIAIAAWNEEAVRFAAKYRIPAGAGTDAHVAQALGSVRIRMRDFDGPQEFLASLRDADMLGKPTSLRYAQVQALKFLETERPRRPPGGPRGGAVSPAPSPVAIRNDRCRGKEKSPARLNRSAGCPPPTTRFARSTSSERFASSTT